MHQIKINRFIYRRLEKLADNRAYFNSESIFNNDGTVTISVCDDTFEALRSVDPDPSVALHKILTTKNIQYHTEAPPKR